MHPSYYYGAHACVLVFDVTRKVTYQHLADWYKELRQYSAHMVRRSPLALLCVQCGCDDTDGIVQFAVWDSIVERMLTLFFFFCVDLPLYFSLSLSLFLSPLHVCTVFAARHGCRK
jgi:hypothetical protein